MLGNHHYLRIHDVYHHHDDLDCYVHYDVYVLEAAAPALLPAAPALTAAAFLPLFPFFL